MKVISHLYSKKLVALFGAALLSGCANQNVQGQSTSSSEFQACSESVWSAAATTDTTAKYYSVAQQAQSCLAYAPVSDHNLGNDKSTTKVLRLHALTITNFLKAGELLQARQAFDAFVLAFPHSDLQLSDGSSFVDSARLLFDATSSAQASNNSLLNASAALKAELRRQHHWNVN